MNARHLTWLALGIGALALLLSTAVTLQAALHAWQLRQQIDTAIATQASQNNQNARPQLYLLRAPSHGAAGAALLTRLRAGARLAGVSLQRAEPRPLDPADPASVKISAQASGSTRAIAAFLYEIEAKAPALVIERARLSTDNGKAVSVDILVSARAQYERSAP
jgi:Type II secretion system (T2SS), protein M subtype b